MARVLVTMAAIIGTVLAAEFECPRESGFYAHATSCDKYWKCEEGEATLQLCGNGLAFDDTDAKNARENCDYSYNINCGQRTEMEPAIGARNCPRLYGVFPDPAKCDVFWSCWNGEASRYQCAPGLAWSRESRVCTWADQVTECKQEEVSDGFQCPEAAEIAPGAFARIAHPDDCRKYYVCMNSNAREYGCPIGTVFKIGDDEISGFCTDPEEVAGCEDYYGDLDVKALKNSELQAGLSEAKPKKAKKPKTRKPEPVVEEETAEEQ